MAFTFAEDTGDRGALALTQEQGKAQVTYRVTGTPDGTPPTQDDLDGVLRALIGGVNNIAPVATGWGGSNLNGRIDRVLPPVHPFQNVLSLSAIESCVGVTEVHEEEDAIEVPGLDPITFSYPNYLQYVIKASFDKRPYFLRPNDLIPTGDGVYYTPAGTPRPYYYAAEWLRFTVQACSPRDDTATATYGMMSFFTASGLAPNNAQYLGSPFVPLGNWNVEMTWMQVPARYLLDVDVDGVLFRSYLKRFIGTINQYDFYGFPAGSLQYLGASPQFYIPNNPTFTKQGLGLDSGLDQDLLMNVKLRFLYTAREGTDLPDRTAFVNRNQVPAGHNLQPNFADRKFYYTVSQTDFSPTYQSFPFELFWTDPLLAQPGGPI